MAGTVKMKSMPDNPRMNRFHRETRERQDQSFPEVGFFLVTCEKQPDGSVEVWSSGSSTPDKTSALWCEMKRQLDWTRKQHERANQPFAPDTMPVEEFDPTPRPGLRVVK